MDVFQGRTKLEAGMHNKLIEPKKGKKVRKQQKVSISDSIVWICSHHTPFGEHFKSRGNNSA